MREPLFLFIQLEFPWVLGPPDGRYLLRSQHSEEARHVLVLDTIGARRATPDGRSRADGRPRRRFTRAGSRGAAVPAMPEPAPVSTTRATIIDAVSVSAERQAEAWLEDLDVERAVRDSAAVLNRALHSHRIASADPFVHEIDPAQALVIRAGWGAGEQVAHGRWLFARELHWSERAGPSSPGGAGGGRRRRTGRSAALRPQERLAQLLGGRGGILVCEELVLRARLDLEQGRLNHAAIELDRALAAALPELRAESRHDLALRIAELEKLSAGVAAQARAAMPDSADAPQEEVVRHALERLEALLRARTATGLP
jgi:hypothetical protein